VCVVVVVGDVHVGEIVRCWKLVTMLNVDVEIGCCWHINVVVDGICWIGWLGTAGCWMLLSWGCVGVAEGVAGEFCSCGMLSWIVVGVVGVLV
jgi:hypothetical protein